MDDELDRDIADLSLPSRAQNALRRSGIATVGELCAQPEDRLLLLRRFGRGGLDAVKAALAARGLQLAADGFTTPLKTKRAVRSRLRTARDLFSHPGHHANAGASRVQRLLPPIPPRQAAAASAAIIDFAAELALACDAAAHQARTLIAAAAMVRRRSAIRGRLARGAGR
ncbi:MAG TPA: DNA-directed RNA polymerase subunit alpha C-terminal domain-containing protein [Stellaceae bacterium]|nr:DNA-directed RNA polymerase subunit alpha C-terminal domain-containing protein [Stellaceae bacterium]